MKTEVRGVGLKAVCEKRGLTQRKLARDLGISQNYIPAIAAISRQAAKLKQQLFKILRLRFEGLFAIVLVNPDPPEERLLIAKG